MTWVNSINTMTNIPPNIHTSPQLPLCPCTRTHSFWEPVAGKLIGSICCLGDSIPSQTPCTPPGHLETPAWLWAPKVMGGEWGREREREAEIQRTNLQLALLPAGMWSDRLASCAGRDAPKGQMVYRSGQDARRERERWDPDKCKKLLALKIKMQHLEFGSIINFTQIGRTI